MQTTDAQQGGEREGEAAEAREAKAAEAPEPRAAEAREPRAAEPGPGGQPDASDDADTREHDSSDDADAEDADATVDADAEEPVTAEQAGEREADTAENLEADQADEADEAAQDQDQVVAERADEAPVAVAEAGEAAPAAADGAVIAADLDAARAEAESYLDDLRRLQADFDNYRKRTLREQTARAASASQALVARLLPVLDNFELAVSAAEQSRDFDRMLKGVEMVFGELREVLQGEGLVKIEAEGKPFDPERHEAVIAVEQEDTEPGTVVDIVRAGYELRGKVLRPAMVKVAK